MELILIKKIQQDLETEKRQLLGLQARAAGPELFFNYSGIQELLAINRKFRFSFQDEGWHRSRAKPRTFHGWHHRRTHVAHKKFNPVRSRGLHLHSRERSWGYGIFERRLRQYIM